MKHGFDVDIAMWMTGHIDDKGLIEQINEEINKVLSSENKGYDPAVVNLNPHFRTIHINEPGTWWMNVADQCANRYAHILQLIEHKLGEHGMHVAGRVTICDKCTCDYRILFFDNGTLYQMTPSELLNEYRALKETLREREEND